MALTKVDSGVVNQLASANMPTGSVLQVVNYKFTDYTNTNSSSFVDITGASTSITPKFSTSKILLLVNVMGLMKNSGTNSVMSLQLVRNGSSIHIWDSLSGYTGSTTLWTGQSSTTYLDSPSTTSSITYKIQWKVTNSGVIQVNNYDASPGYSISTITLMEIAG